MASCQIVEEGESSSSLVIHEQGAYGYPRCGIRPRPWNGNPMEVADKGDDEVTCQRCLNLSEQDTT